MLFGVLGVIWESRCFLNFGFSENSEDSEDSEWWEGSEQSDLLELHWVEKIKMRMVGIFFCKEVKIM